MAIPLLAALAKSLIGKIATSKGIASAQGVADKVAGSKIGQNVQDTNNVLGNITGNNTDYSALSSAMSQNDLNNSMKNSQSLAQQIMSQSGYTNGQMPLVQVPFMQTPLVQQPLQGGISQNNIQPTVQPTTQPQPLQVAQPAQTNNKFIQGLANGLADFQRGYNENLNNGLAPSNWTSTQFTETIQPNNTKLADKQNELKLQLDSNGNRVYNDNVVNALAEGKNSGYKDLANWVSNNQDAYPKTQTYDKGTFGKIGEGLGTATRFINSPTGQALIGGAAGMLTGNPLFALGNAYNMGSNRSKNDIYNQILNKYGIEPSQGFFYNLNDKDLNAMSNADYRYNWNLNREKANTIAQQKADQQYELGKERNDISQDRVNKNYEIGKTRNGIAQQRVNISGNKGPKKGWGPNGEWTKQEYTKYLNEDLADYSQLSSEQQKKMRPKMLSTYGKDFTSVEKSITKDPLDEYINNLR